MLGFEIVAQEELETVLGKEKYRSANDSRNNRDEKIGAEQELEELEAPPAWEREDDTSTAERTPFYQVHVKSRGDAILATGGMVAGRMFNWKDGETNKGLST